MHKHCCKLAFVDSVIENVAKLFALEIGDLGLGNTLAYYVIEVKLTECRLCKIEIIIVCFHKIVDSFKVYLAHIYVFLVALLDHFLIVTLAIAAILLNNSHIGDSVLDVGRGFVSKPNTDLACTLVQVLIEKLVVTELAVREDLQRFVIVICINETKLADVFLFNCGNRRNGCADDCGNY